MLSLEDRPVRLYPTKPKQGSVLFDAVDDLKHFGQRAAHRLVPGSGLASCDPKSRTQLPSSGDCGQVLAQLPSRMGAEVDSQVAAPAETRTPNMHRAINSLLNECGWKDGDRGGLAPRQNPGGEKSKTNLTLTGLLMEGLGVTTLSRSFLERIANVRGAHFERCAVLHTIRFSLPVRSCFNTSTSFLSSLSSAKKR